MTEFFDHSLRFSKYGRRGLCTLTSVFPNNKNTSSMIKTVPGTSGRLSHKYGVPDSPALVRMIFTTFLSMVLERVATGDVFMVPGTTEASILLKPMRHEEVGNMVEKGWLLDYDFIGAYFKVPQFKFDFGPKNSRQDKTIKVPKYILNKALDNTQKGSIPWTFLPKVVEYDRKD